eukprot:6472045-Amphidinium_carterae.2
MHRGAVPTFRALKPCNVKIDCQHQHKGAYLARTLPTVLASSGFVLYMPCAVPQSHFLSRHGKSRNELKRLRGSVLDQL